VDDHQGDLRLLHEAFADCGHPCQLTCENPTKEAQKILQTNLVVSDLGTRSEGIALIQIIRNGVRLQATAVIALSGCARSANQVTLTAARRIQSRQNSLKQEATAISHNNRKKH
jgi:hypothetical protein